MKMLRDYGGEEMPGGATVQLVARVAAFSPAVKVMRCHVAKRNGPSASGAVVPYSLACRAGICGAGGTGYLLVAKLQTAALAEAEAKLAAQNERRAGSH